MRSLRVGVIGTGAFAESCHLPGLQSNSAASVVALCGRDEAHTRAVAHRWGVPEITTDYEELCFRRDIDAVTIASPDAFHARQAQAAFVGGKHVFCEKPLGISVGEAKRMLHTAEGSGKIHQVAFTFRYLYGVQELKRRLLQGDIGQPHYIRLRHESWEGLQPDFTVSYREKRTMVGGGVLYNVGSHLFDLSHYLVGRSEDVTGFTMLLPRERRDKISGQLTPVETDDIAAAWYTCGPRLRGEWFASRATPPFDSRDKAYVEVVGAEGSLRASLSRGSREALRISRPHASDWVDLRLPEQALDGQPHCLRRMIASFVDACLRGTLDETIDASFYEGMIAQQAITAVEATACDSHNKARMQLGG